MDSRKTEPRTPEEVAEAENREALIRGFRALRAPLPRALEKQESR